MLILSRKLLESINIGEDTVITILKIGECKCLHSHRVHLGIKAPREVKVHRSEIFDRIKNQQELEKVSTIDSKQTDLFPEESITLAEAV